MPYSIVYDAEASDPFQLIVAELLVIEFAVTLVTE
jgi:hypothetical protein